ncbi:MAG: hypothetical protein LBQ26_01530, partial [Holosporales bacterium]|nr:hypothetical protein [Holosporales bacterium]
MWRPLYTLGAIGVAGCVIVFWMSAQRTRDALPQQEKNVELSEHVFKPAKNKPPKKLVIVLHGYGADAENLWPIGHEISQALPEAEIHIPNGFDPCEGSVGGRQWFAMGNWTLPEWRTQLAQTKVR